MIEARCWKQNQCEAFGGSWAHQKAVDYGDAWGGLMRLYNLCRCKTWVQKGCPPCGDGDPAPQGGAASSSFLLPRAPRAVDGEDKTCGLYFPAKMWTNEPRGSNKFYCKVNWEALLTMPETGALMMFAWGGHLVSVAFD